jgi:tRNA threonylcarbamoyladenosine biosynthesis protein TsaE
MQMISKSPDDTARAARDLAAKLESRSVIFLYGTLGMGKTVFARALIRALSNDETLEVPSPTFTLVQTYDTDKATLFHFDLYRLEDAEEIFELGWEDALAEGITIVEWPERLGPYIPARRLDITFSAVENDTNARQILIEKRD